LPARNSQGACRRAAPDIQQLFCPGGVFICGTVPSFPSHPFYCLALACVLPSHRAAAAALVLAADEVLACKGLARRMQSSLTCFVSMFSSVILFLLLFEAAVPSPSANCRDGAGSRQRLIPLNPQLEPCEKKRQHGVLWSLTVRSASTQGVCCGAVVNRPGSLTVPDSKPSWLLPGRRGRPRNGLSRGSRDPAVA